MSTDVEVPRLLLIEEREKAILVEQDGNRYWLPRSQISYLRKDPQKISIGSTVIHIKADDSSVRQWQFAPHGGMSLRDYFAAAALPQVLAAQVKLVELGGRPESEKVSARTAYDIADAMILERGKTAS